MIIYPDQLYNIRHKETGKWIATRKDGQTYLKLFRRNCGEYLGNSLLINIASSYKDDYIIIKKGEEW